MPLPRPAPQAWLKDDEDNEESSAASSSKFLDDITDKLDDLLNVVPLDDVPSHELPLCVHDLRLHCSFLL